MPWRDGHTAAMIGLSVMLPFSDDHLRHQERHPAENTSACTTVGIANVPRDVGAKYVGRKPITTMTSIQSASRHGIANALMAVRWLCVLDGRCRRNSTRTDERTVYGWDGLGFSANTPSLQFAQSRARRAGKNLAAIVYKGKVG